MALVRIVSLLVAGLVLVACGSGHRDPPTHGSGATSASAATQTSVSSGVSPTAVSTTPRRLVTAAGPVSQIAQVSKAALNAYSIRSNHADTQFWTRRSGFVAVDPGIPCWYCYDTPATTAALLSTGIDGSTREREIAIDTWSQAIHRFLRPSGEITRGNQSDGVGTGFFAVQLGISYLELRRVLPPATRALWRGAMVRMANFLQSSGATTFYVNGNVNLRQAEVMWLTWAITGQQTFLAGFRSELQFALHPPAPRWKGYGLRITHGGSLGDRLASGYLTESDNGHVGFDPSYTMLQLDTAVQMWVLNHDREELELADVEFNQLRGRVNSEFILNAHGGTRRDDIVPFLTPAPFVLWLTGDRPGLHGYWLKQIPALRQQYKQAATYANTGFYNGVSSWLGTALLAVRYPAGIMSAPCSRRRAVCRASG